MEVPPTRTVTGLPRACGINAHQIGDSRHCGPSGRRNRLPRDLSSSEQTLAQRRNRLSILATMMMALVLALACGTGPPTDETIDGQDHLPTPDRSLVQIIDPEPPNGLIDPAVVAAYEQGYSHMRASEWFAATAAYDEAIRIQPDVAGLYEARGTAYMYAGKHDEALADYSAAIQIDPTDAGLWRRRSHAHTIAPTPQPEKGIEDATRAIELDPSHHMGYGHRAIAYTQLPTPDWENALADMDRHIELFPSHDAEAYKMRAWIHDNLGNRDEAERDRRLAR